MKLNVENTHENTVFKEKYINRSSQITVTSSLQGCHVINVTFQHSHSCQEFSFFEVTVLLIL